MSHGNLQGPGKSFKKVAKKPTKRHRTAYTKDQIARLESSFAVQPYPDLMLRQEIAESLALTEHKICLWFQNRRAKQRKEQELSKYQPLPSSSFPAQQNTVPLMPPMHVGAGYLRTPYDGIVPLVMPSPSFERPTTIWAPFPLAGKHPLPAAVWYSPLSMVYPSRQ